MKTNTQLADKSYGFALRSIELYRYLGGEKKEFVLSKQMLRSGTSIGANVEEAIGGRSGKDFQHKISIVYKESREAHYWLRLLRNSHFLDERHVEGPLNDCEELLKISGSILVTLKKRNS